MNSFYLVGTQDVKRANIIKEICLGNNIDYKSEYPHVVKLCRICISNICKELTEMINWEVIRYKRFSEIKNQIELDIYPYYVSNKQDLLLDIDISITDSKFLYNKYKNLLQDLKKKQLYTKGCIVCNS